MDMKKIGGFLRRLRKEKGLTQEQLAESLFVSGRTVSRWETGTNMPDLSILILLAEFYDVEIKEILDGERRKGTVEKEMKETLSKVADYSRMEKEKAAKAGSMAFSLMFLICAAAIVIQLITSGSLRAVLGESVALLSGGIVYIALMVYNGVWESAMGTGNILLRDILVSVVCAGVFAGLLAICYIRLGAEAEQTAHMALIFFAGTAAAGFALLRALAHGSRKKKAGMKQVTSSDNSAGR